MNMVRFFETEPTIDDATLGSVEDHAGIKFPDAYRQHILQTNGGYCEPSVFRFRERGTCTSSRIDGFLAVTDGPHNNLRKYIDIYKKDAYRLPFRMIPIAHDPGGNLICISCAGNDLGFVYFWDHELEPPEMSETYRENLHLVATSFEAFLSWLCSG